MEKRLAGINAQLFPMLVLVDRLSICPILFSFADRIQDMISMPLSLMFQSHSKEKPLSQSSSSESEVTQQKNCLNNWDGRRMSRDDVKFVMEQLELSCSQEGEKLGECFGPDELTAMFDENEPSMEELKETFNVFDKNRDGFIDAEELQRVLGLLGSNRGKDLDDCNKMIAKFDHNKDGKIDFNEFVKFMEIALC